MAVYRPDPGLLRRQVESLRDQTMSDWQCYVGIDGTDIETETLVSAIVGNDERFTILAFEKRLGFYRNFERLLMNVPSDVSWIALSDQDDQWYAKKLEFLVSNLSSSSLVCGQARLVKIRDDVKSEIAVGVTSRHASGLGEMLFDNAVSGALAVFRRDVLSVALPFPEPTDVAYHDHWLGVCAFACDGVRFLPVVVQDYIQHENNVIGEEEASILQRFRFLASKAGKFDAVSYVISNRWAWRVNMTRSLLAQAGSLDPQDSKVLSTFARNAFSLQLLRIAIRAIRSGRPSRLRVVSLLFASMLAPLVGRKVNDRRGRG
jgi:glycosyltransferase involved in cell wall biosynthesis